MQKLRRDPQLVLCHAIDSSIAIFDVSHQRMSFVGKMHADLMRPACHQLYFYHGKTVFRSDRRDKRLRALPFLCIVRNLGNIRAVIFCDPIPEHQFLF